VNRMACARATVTSVVLSLVFAAGATADERFPVRSEDDTSQPLESRVAAIDAVLGPLGNRLERIGLPPNPVDPELEGALMGLEAEAHALAVGANCFAAGVPIGTEVTATTIADEDAFAADSSTRGLANQARAITTVLNIGHGRLIRIATDWFEVDPGLPPSPVRSALAMVEADAYALAVGAATAGGFELPPSPICPAT
jgi:hypothetical protein